MNKTEKTEKIYHCKGHPTVKHTDDNCNGDLAISGEGVCQLPTGMGFDGGEFVVDLVRYSTYQGFCMKCNVEGMFIRTDKKPKAIRKTPRSINNRIERTANV